MGKMNQKKIPLESLALGLYCSHQDRATYIITQEPDWNRLWNTIERENTFQRNLPPVNFSQYMIIAVFMGEHLQGGAQTRITGARERSGKLLVAILETRVDEGGEGPSWSVQPYHIVKVPRIHAPIDFLYK